MIWQDASQLRGIQQYGWYMQNENEKYGDDRALFLNYPRYRQMIFHCLIGICVEAKGLSAEFREATGDQVEWAYMDQFQRELFRESDADPEMLWELAKNGVPKLLAFCKAQLHRE